MPLFDAIFLGIVQGLSEFLPISSSGHLVVLHAWLSDVSGGLAFDAVLHFATALAVALYFWRDIAQLLRAIPAFFLRRFEESGVRLLLALLVATIPAVLLGLMLESVMATLFRAPALVACTLLIGSVIIYYAEKRGAGNMAIGAPSTKGALIVGLFQSLALIPGMSRSGMALSGGMFLGLSREAATRFSFLLAVPILLGAGAKKILDIMQGGEAGIAIVPLVCGALAAFVVGLAVIHFFLRFVRTHSLMPFVYYRVALAALLFVLVFGGVL